MTFLADGIFETMRVYSGIAFKLDEHLVRLRASAERLHIEVPTDTEKLVLREIDRAQQDGLADALLRVTLSRIDQESRLAILLDPLPHMNAEWYANGIRVATSPDRRNEFAPDAGMKTAALLASILDIRAVKHSDYDDLIFLDTKSHVCEGSASNVFLYSDNVLITPPLTCGALPGITRRTVFEMATAIGIPASDSKPIDPAVVFSADEMFLTSSVREIVPVASVDGKTIGSGKPGALTKELMQDYQRMTRCNS